MQWRLSQYIWSVMEATPADMTESVTNCEIGRCSRFHGSHWMWEVRILETLHFHKKRVWQTWISIHFQSIHCLQHIYLWSENTNKHSHYVKIYGRVLSNLHHTGEWHELKETDQKKCIKHRWVIHAFPSILTWQQACGMEILPPENSVVSAHAAAD